MRDSFFVVQRKPRDSCVVQYRLTDEKIKNRGIRQIKKCDCTILNKV